MPEGSYSPTRRIPLRRKDGSTAAYAVVDADDYERLAPYRWWLNDQGYAVRTEGPRDAQRKVRMHRQVLGVPADDKRSVDHINRDTLDNRKANLRLCSHAQNHQNQASRCGTSRYRGVSFDKQTGRWRATVMISGKARSLGRFDTEEEAHQAASHFRAEHMPFSADARAS